MNKCCAFIVPHNKPLYAKTVLAELAQNEIAVDCFLWDDINYNKIFDTTHYATVIIADAKNCPAFLQNEVLEYLAKGGNVVTLGGPPFSNEYYNFSNKETSTEELKRMMIAGQFDKTIILPLDSENDLVDFAKDTYNPDSKKYDGAATLSVVDGGITSPRCVRYYTNDFVINESFEKPIHIKSGHNVLGFYAKAFKKTRTITIQLIQEDGDMFKTRITPSENFEYFILSKKDFVYSGNRKGLYKNEGRYHRPLYVDFSQVEKIQFGHALSHAYSVAGEHAFFLNELSSANIAVLNDKKIIIDGLYPEYKFFPVTNAVSMKSYDKQAFLSEQNFDVPSDLFSFSCRAQSTGFQKERRSRFIPLVEAYDKNEIRCGLAAYMILNISYCERKTPYNNSAIVAFTTNENSFYENGGAKAVAQAISSLYLPVVLVEGGSDEYIYFSDSRKAIYGAAVLVRDQANADGYHIKITVGNTARIYSIDELSPIDNPEGLDLRRISFEENATEDAVSVQIIKGAEQCDVLTHDITIYEEKPVNERHFAYIKSGENEIYIDNKVTRFFGVNYMPTCNTAMETGEEFEHYVAACSYDPDAVEIDLKRIKDIGMNAVSIFLHYEQSIRSNNILHLVNLCRKYGLYVDLSIRPHANPFDFNGKEVEEIISKYRFNENDTIVAYDIAWERYVGTYEECYGNFNGRKSFNSEWRRFLVNRYGSFEKAEAAFGCSLPKNNKGDVIGVSDDMLREDGKHTTMVAVFRRFIDEQVAYKHIKAMQFIKSIDENHMISPRSGDASTIPLVDPGIYGYDYKALSYSMDFMSPESYALADYYSSMRQGIFTNIYSRYANKDNVIQWMEFGKSIWIGSNFAENSISKEFQAEYYRSFFDMLIAGHTTGLYAWWWAGGYRVGENSDFGIISPDGSDRPVTKIFREYADKFLNAAPLKKAEVQIAIDRDKHADGLLSMYHEVERTLFGAIESGKMVEFVDLGNGKTSADVDLAEVGDANAEGSVLKYLNGIITNISVSLDNNSPMNISNEEKIILGDGKRLTLSVTIINSENALWLDGDDFGSVSLKSSADSDFDFSVPLLKKVPYREFVTFEIVLNCIKNTTICCALNAKDRTYFGENIKIKLE